MNIYGYMNLSSREKARRAPPFRNKPARTGGKTRTFVSRNVFPRVFVTAISLAGMAYLVLRPDLCIPAARRGLLLWAGTVLPALLPFFFLTSLLSSAGIAESLSRGADRPMNVLFRQSGVSFVVFLTSILSGYPVGAKMTAELCKKGILSRSEGTRTACLCSTSGPLFVIGSVGTALFGDKRIGVAIYLSHLLAALGCGFVFRFYGEPPGEKTVPARAERLIRRRLFFRFFRPARGRIRLSVLSACRRSALVRRPSPRGRIVFLCLPRSGCRRSVRGRADRMYARVRRACRFAAIALHRVPRGGDRFVRRSVRHRAVSVVSERFLLQQKNIPSFKRVADGVFLSDLLRARFSVFRRLAP